MKKYTYVPGSFIAAWLIWELIVRLGGFNEALLPTPYKVLVGFGELIGDGVLFFGIGQAPAIVIIFIAAFFPVLLSTVSAIQNIDPVYIKVARNFGIKQPELLFKIVLPAVFPGIASGLHIALGTAWIFLVTGEMVGSQTGLGFLIIDMRNNLRNDLLMVAILTIGFVGLLLDWGVSLIEKWIYKRWGIEK